MRGNRRQIPLPLAGRNGLLSTVSARAPLSDEAMTAMLGPTRFTWKSAGRARAPAAGPIRPRSIGHAGPIAPSLLCTLHEQRCRCGVGRAIGETLAYAPECALRAVAYVRRMPVTTQTRSRLRGAHRPRESPATHASAAEMRGWRRAGRRGGCVILHGLRGAPAHNSRRPALRRPNRRYHAAYMT